MTGNGDGKGKTKVRKIKIEVNRDETLAYTSVAAVDIEGEPYHLIEVVIPDTTLVKETYRMGGNVAPFEVLRETMEIAFAAINASMAKVADDPGKGG